MKLTREQFDRIDRIYQERRRRAREEARERQEAFLRADPRWAELNREILQLNGDLMNATLDRDETRLPFLKARRQALIKEKKEQLAAAGLKEADFEPCYQCPHCGDTGWVDSRECSCRQKLIIEEFYSDSVLWKRAEKENFQSFSLNWYDGEKKLKAFQGRTARQVMEENLKTARDYVAGFARNRDGILLTGPVGTGKTFLCNCIAGALLRADFSVLYISAQEFFDKLAEVTFDKEEQDELLTEQFSEADLLIIDDLGTEFSGRKLAANALFTVLNERIIRNRGTLISTNLGLDELAERYSEPVLSRIMGEFRIMRFVGQDIRLAKRLQ
ncbi:MAG: ATP-binding protein, partial [Lachnospiraceae bacterium]|nr:ATP-binding protein [Lachnospiraceae bacterium]